MEHFYVYLASAIIAAVLICGAVLIYGAVVIARANNEDAELRRRLGEATQGTMPPLHVEPQHRWRK